MTIDGDFVHLNEFEVMPIGKIGELKHDSEDWSTYKTTFTSWLLVHEITDAAESKAAWIAVLGGNAVGLSW